MSGLGTLPLGLRQTLHRAFGDVAVKTSISSNGNRPLRKSINTSKGHPVGFSMAKQGNSIPMK